MIDIILVLVFIGAVFTLWYRVSIKIPELVAIPDEVIALRLEEDASKLHLFLLNIKTWWRERHYEYTFWSLFGKLVYRVHIMLLRSDNNIVYLLKNIRTKIEVVNDNGNGNGEYWKRLKEEQTVVAASNRIHHARSIPSNVVQEVRMKK